MGENILIPKLTKRMGALKFLRKWMSAKQRKKLAKGLIMSRILYGIQVWGNMVTKTTVEKVQNILTLVMRWITGGSQYKDSAD